MQGKVYLIGMGPGDPDMITLKAVKAIETCDVLIYDRLVNPILLEYNKMAKMIYVGKASSEHAKTQDEINDILVNEANKGLIVGRLKGGDPFVFGRGGEEALYLKEHEIEYDIIPGITSSIAVPASAGIPVTHRGVATSFHVITGHEQGDISTLEWEALSKVKGTLVFLMGVENLDLIINNLMSMGKDRDCPAAVIMNGTRYNQKEAYGTLENISKVCMEQGIKSPAIIIIGDVVKLHDSIGWKYDKPLSGLNMVVTRPYDKSDNLIEGLTAFGAKVQNLPCIDISPLEVLLDKKSIDESDAFVFSSSYGVRYFIQNLKNSSIDIRTIKGKLYGVGVSIKEELESNGLFGCVIPDKQNSEEISHLIHNTLEKGLNITLVSGNLGGDKLANKLSDYKRTLLKVYETIEGCESEAYNEADAIIFTSPSCVRGFLMKNSIEEFKNRLALCIGKTTADEANKYGFENIRIPERSSEEGIVELLLNWRKLNA